MVVVANFLICDLVKRDINISFINGFKKFYVEHLMGSIMISEKDNVLKLNKALFGLKQYPIVWNKRVDDLLNQNGYFKNIFEHGIYVKGMNQDKIIIMSLYVDDQHIK